jgi:hypothetical protein
VRVRVRACTIGTESGWAGWLYQHGHTGKTFVRALLIHGLHSDDDLGTAMPVAGGLSRWSSKELASLFALGSEYGPPIPAPSSHTYSCAHAQTRSVFLPPPPPLFRTARAAMLTHLHVLVACHTATPAD